MSCVGMCIYRSRKTDDSTKSGDVGHADNPVYKTEEEKSANITKIDGNGVKYESPALEKDTMSVINVISNKSRLGEKDETIRQEWMELARVVDRLLLITFTTIHIFMIFVIFVVMPDTWNGLSFHWQI